MRPVREITHFLLKNNSQFILEMKKLSILLVAHASYHSIQGEIKAGWKQSSPGVFEYQVTVPPNCSAVVVLPGGEKKLEPGEHLMIVRE